MTVFQTQTVDLSPGSPRAVKRQPATTVTSLTSYLPALYLSFPPAKWRWKTPVLSAVQGTCEWNGYDLKCFKLHWIPKRCDADAIWYLMLSKQLNSINIWNIILKSPAVSFLYKTVCSLWDRFYLKYFPLWPQEVLLLAIQITSDLMSRGPWAPVFISVGWQKTEITYVKLP